MEVSVGYKQTEVGVIPEDWEVTKLGDLIDYTKGYAFKSNVYTSDGVRIVRVSDTTYDSIVDTMPVFVPRKSASQYSRWRLRENDLVVSTVGSKPPMYDSMVGKVIIIKHQYDGALLNQNAVLFRDKKKRPYFQQILLNHFRSKRYLVFIESIFRGNANQASITLKELFDFAIPCPLADTEQRAIAIALSDVDALIAKLDLLIAKKRDLKQAAMQQLLTGQTRLLGFSGEWEVKRLGDVASINKGTQLHSSESTDSGRFAHLNGGINPSGYTEAANTLGGTIAISEGGNSCGYVQFMLEPYWCGGHCYSVISRGIDNGFLYHALKGQQSALMALRVGSGLPNVQKTALLNFEVFFPADKGEQVAIATVLSDMDTVLAALEARRDKTRALKQGMMQELLTGRIRLV